MRKLIYGAVIAALCVGFGINANAKKVHTIGDSTMANYNEQTEVKRGWGMYLQQFLEGIDVVNYARGGRDTRVFYNDHWPAVKNAIAEGDYVIIQFAHNDEKLNGVDRQELYDYYMSHGEEDKAKALDTRGTTPSTTYRAYLEKFIDETRALGGIPILAGPVCRCYFSGNTIKRNGKHDLGDNYQILTDEGLKTGTKLAADDHTMDYVYHMEQVALAKNVPFINMTTGTEQLYLQYGSAKCHDALFCPGDNTHYNTTGATLAARLCAELMQEKGIMTEYIHLTSNLSVSPAEGDMGDAYKGQVLTKEFSLSGFGLEPAEGTVEITASEGITLSTDKNSWSTSLSLSYAGATLIQTFYASLTLTNDGETTGTITITQDEKSLEIPVKARAVAMTGGTEVMAEWMLISNSNCKLTGPATVVDENLVGMTHKQYSGGMTWPEGSGMNTNTTAQLTEIEGGTWPKEEIDESPARYVEFGLTANTGLQLNINHISMYVGAWGGNMMKCHVKYSKENDFGNPTTILATERMAAKNMYEAKATPVVELKEGETLRLRIYPWIDNSSSDATGKFLILGDVKIGGVAFDPTGVEHTFNTTLKPTAYYTINGTAVSKPQSGICIERLSDGSTRKVIRK